MSDYVKQTSDSTFAEDVLKSEQLCLVDFWAPWCQPCKALAPALEKLAEHYQGKLSVFKCNVDENADVTRQYGIQGLPTLLLFRNKEMVANQVGLLGYPDLCEWVENAL